jgi:hypothetical protein
MARSIVTPVVKCKFQSRHSQTVAPQEKVCQHNLVASWRLARQDRTAALKFQNNQYRGSDPKAITERRSRAYMVMSPKPNSAAASAAPTRMARVANFSMLWRLARQIEAAAPLGYGLGVRATVLFVMKLKRGNAVLPRH